VPPIGGVGMWPSSGHVNIMHEEYGVLRLRHY
jgi:hypothetical protein